VDILCPGCTRIRWISYVQVVHALGGYPMSRLYTQ